MMRIRRMILWMVVLLVGGLQSCYNYKQIGLVQERDNLPVYEEVPYVEYRIRANDQLQFRLMTTHLDIMQLLGGNENSSTQYTPSYRVYLDGTVDLPLVDSIPVAGLTVEEAQTVVQEYYRGIIPDAEVKLALANKTFTVIGDIGRGVFTIQKEKMTIFQALAISGDLFNSGDRKQVRIVRQVDGRPEVLEFDIRTNTIIDSKYYYVYPNDVVYVQRAKGSFYKFESYSTFIALVTSSLSLLITVLSYIIIR